MFGLFKKSVKSSETPKRFPPVPDWRPEITPPIADIVGRMMHYADKRKDFAIFRYGTIVILPDGLDDDSAVKHAKDALHKVFHAHPDMNPLRMSDGNVLVRYNHDVANIVLKEVVDAHWAEIDKNHQQALATDEVLITPLGPNVFDDFGKKSLFGRCFMFMDAQDPQLIKIERANV